MRVGSLRKDRPCKDRRDSLSLRLTFAHGFLFRPLQLDHGVLPMVFEVIGDYARDKFGAVQGNKRLAIANKRFRSFRNTHPGLRLPNIDFLGGSSFVTAFEHRHSLSVRRLILMVRPLF